MLGTMHEDRTSVRDAGADTVCAFDPLRPHATQPDAPLFELLGFALVAAVVDGDSFVVAQENHVRLLADNGIKAIYLFLSLKAEVAQGLTRNLELTLCEDVGY
jgi:hypothetical protein